MLKINALIDGNSNLLIRFFGTKVGDKYCATGKDWKMSISLSVTTIIRHSVTRSRDVTKEEELN